MAQPDEAGESGFLAGLRRHGCEPTVQAGVVTFDVVALRGAHAGSHVRSGVGQEELGAWPSVPPHWVHLPQWIRIPITNAQPSPVADWLKHSRQIANWGNAADAVQAWLGHVRAVLQEAV